MNIFPKIKLGRLKNGELPSINLCIGKVCVLGLIFDTTLFYKIGLNIGFSFSMFKSPILFLEVPLIFFTIAISFLEYYE